MKCNIVEGVNILKKRDSSRRNVEKEGNESLGTNLETIIYAIGPMTLEGKVIFGVLSICVLDCNSSFDAAKGKPLKRQT
jgi:hypothetical protein